MWRHALLLIRSLPYRKRVREECFATKIRSLAVNMSVPMSSQIPTQTQASERSTADTQMNNTLRTLNSVTPTSSVGAGLSAMGDEDDDQEV